MIGTSEVIATVKPGAIVQLSPKFEGDLVYHLQVVAAVHSWGCDLSPDGGGATFPVAWEHFELTGGTIIWKPDGSLFRPAAPATRHLP